MGINGKTYNDLKKIARELGIPDYWRMKRVDLEKAIKQAKNEVEVQKVISDCARAYRIKRLAEIIALGYGVDIYIDKKEIIYKGKADKVQKAQEDFEEYLEELNRIRTRLWKRAKRHDKDTTGLEKSFDLGYLQGLSDNIGLQDAVDLNPDEYLQNLKLRDTYYKIGMSLHSEEEEEKASN